MLGLAFIEVQRLEYLIATIMGDFDFVASFSLAFLLPSQQNSSCREMG